MATYDYDLVTIGAGSGGVRASRLAASRHGARVAIVENSRVGGTCVMRGCVPKKLLVYGAHFAEDFEDAAGYGWTLEGARHDWGALIDHKQQELTRLEGVYHRLLRDAGVTLLEGRGRVVDPHTVEVDGRRVTAERILIAVGGWPTLPDIPGIEHAITSNEALDLPTRPERIVIVGGGFIAVEFAGIFNALGSRVTEVIRAGQILRGFDEDLRASLASEMEKKGIRIRRECQVRSIEKRADGTLSLLSDCGEEMEADAVMYATGRAPNTANLGLEEIGVTLGKGGAVVVDEWNRSSVDSIYAIGDVTDRVNLTPVAIREGMAFVATVFGNTPTPVDYGAVPSAVFSQPPVGTVGLTEAEARKQEAVDVYVSRFRPMRFTLSGRDEKTMMKLIVSRETDRVLGAHMVGVDAPEIIQGIGIAMKAGATKAHFDATIGIHPTAAEEFVTMRDPLPDPSFENTE
ncbi:glutathione-disulfide reductase [Roseospira marina]|uniref:Glutathione reductase n=1 Tax=Roseospira marina TaxID=140057 RepID=A0A5M6IE31_9PROT|nr:glutathione-disulfide reductase [Roseospira marina]KAA5606540.1 glutathione-disulfide reductase [Roseospira marina]MBB4314031.1 glutathione reductase (NADPH) [Roseospira marina]MBB5087192.1 glutathione reductase (NADPH) [Roseospira marina]